MKLSNLISMCSAVVAVVAVAAMAALPPAVAADWPSKPIRMVVPFPAGGSSDVVARQISQHLSTVLGQQFVVDNRAGAAGNIGTDAVAKAAPDGYTLSQSTSGPLANNKLLYHNMPFDAAKDLTPVALVGEIPLVIAVNPGAMKAKNLKELVALAKNAPEPISVGHPGAGTIGHLAMESLKSVSGLNLQMVPYKGDTPAITDLLGGQIQMVGAPVTSFIPNIQAGKLRALAVTSKARFPGLPNVPTALEQGVNLEAGVWFAVVGPAGLPKPIVTRLNKEINRYTNSPEGRAQLAQFALVPANVSPEALGDLMKSEPAKWKPIVESAKITLD